MKQMRWVGVLGTGGARSDWEFVAISSVHADGARETIADFPDRGQYGIPVEVHNRPGGSAELRMRLGRDVLTFGEVHPEAMSEGECRVDSEIRPATYAGRFRLWPRTPADTDAFQRHVGDHESTDGRQLTFHLISDLVTDEPVFLCAEGDVITRLHPIARTEFLSERLELYAVDNACSVRAVVPNAASGVLPDAPPDASPGVAPDVIPEVTLDAAPTKPTALQPKDAWTEEDVSFNSGNIRIAGTLMRPLGSGAFPAVVMLHGAGGGRRDFYRLFGAHFVRTGIAVLIFDKRGTGYSEGTAASSLFDRSKDAEAGLSYLQSRPDIDPDRVGVWGFSNGGWSAPMLAARRRDVAFLIVLGAAGVSPAEAEIHRKAFELREHGIAEEEIAVVLDLWRMIYEYFNVRVWSDQTSKDFDQLAAQVAASPSLARVRLQHYAVANPILSPIPPFRNGADLAEAVADVSADDTRDLTYDPVEAYRQIQCPVLMCIGALDGNVPAEMSAKRASEALEQAGNRQGTIRVLPGAGHMLNLVDPAEVHGATSEELIIGFHRFQFAPGLLEFMCEWANEASGTAIR